MSSAYNHRLRLVAHARLHGLKPTARLFQTTVPTVRKWLRRYQQQGPRGLVELSRAPHRQPGKTPAAVEQQVVALRQQLFTFGARRLIREFDLPLSHRALERIWRQHGLLRRRQRKYQRKQDLAHIKATWRVLQQISADTKDLDDIPHYWPQAQAFDLPAVQYTARDVRSGLLFWAFAQRRSASASALFAARIQQHLERCGVTLRDLVWQTDNGSEFIGGHDRRGHPTGFPAALGDSRTSASHPPLTPFRATSKPFTVSSKMSSSTWNHSPVAAISWPKPSLTSSTSISPAPIPTNTISPLGRSSNSSSRAGPSNSACFHPSFWIITSTAPGDTISLGIPRAVSDCTEGGRLELQWLMSHSPASRAVSSTHWKHPPDVGPSPTLAGNY